MCVQSIEAGSRGEGSRCQAEVPVFFLNSWEHEIIIGTLKFQSIFQNCFHSIAIIIAAQSWGNITFKNAWCSSLDEDVYSKTKRTINGVIPLKALKFI